jgi:hypothetical protein
MSQVDGLTINSNRTYNKNFNNQPHIGNLNGNIHNNNLNNLNNKSHFNKNIFDPTSINNIGSNFPVSNNQPFFESKPVSGYNRFKPDSATTNFNSNNFLKNQTSEITNSNVIIKENNLNKFNNKISNMPDINSNPFAGNINIDNHKSYMNKNSFAANKTNGNYSIPSGITQSNNLSNINNNFNIQPNVYNNRFSHFSNTEKGDNSEVETNNNGFPSNVNQLSSINNNQSNNIFIPINNQQQGQQNNETSSLFEENLPSRRVYRKIQR